MHAAAPSPAGTRHGAPADVIGHRAPLLKGLCAMVLAAVLLALVPGAARAAENASPTAAMTADCRATSCLLDGRGSTDPEDALIDLDWDFGDGTRGNGETAAHTYGGEGTYTVTLTVTDYWGVKASTSSTVTVQSPDATVYALDRFERDVTDGWGYAEVGGGWSAFTTPFNVLGNTGTVELSYPGAARLQRLGAVSAQDVDAALTVSTDRLAGGWGQATELVLRRVATNVSYKGRVRLLPTGGVTLTVLRQEGTVVTRVTPEITVQGLSVAAGQPLKVRFQAVGTNPTTLRMSATTAETATWQVEGTDATARLQTAGSVGVRSYLSLMAEDLPVVLSYDDLRVTAPRSDTAAAEPVADDDFSRDVATGWGTAVAGGAWANSGADFAVGGGVGIIRLNAPGLTRVSSLAQIAERDVDAAVSVTTDRAATGGGTYAFLTARRTSAGNEYRTRVRITEAGTVALLASRMISGSDAIIGGEVTVPGVVSAPQVPLRVRAQVVGANPTAIRVRVWPAGQPEPTAWQLQVTDATASLQGPGAVSLRGALSSTASAPVVLSFDDLAVQRIAG